jgi:transcriptional regulator with XRE-family HTH domain
MSDPDQRRLLGDFVRAHRERLRADGPPGRRRTPGLRREELATRAAISATWCAWIEQGRDVQASPQALSRLANALVLTRAERAYLFELAGRRDPDAAAPEMTEDCPVALVTLVRWTEHPAYGLDRLWNACCWNGAAERLFEGWLGEGRQRNLLRFIFLDPKARKLIPGWRERARRVLSEFRADYSRGFKDPRMRLLVDSLRRDSPDFAEAWDAQTVTERAGGLRTFVHSLDGPLRFEQHTFSPSERPDYKLVVLTPA